MTDAPDRAQLWARDYNAQQYEKLGASRLAQMSREGGNDDIYIDDLAKAFRAGQAESEARVKLLEASLKEASSVILILVGDVRLLQNFNPAYGKGLTGIERAKTWHSNISSIPRDTK